MKGLMSAVVLAMAVMCAWRVGAMDLAREAESLRLLTAAGEPLPCGVFEGLPKRGAMPTQVRWVEAPKWSRTIPTAKREISCLLYDTDATVSLSADLRASADLWAPGAWRRGMLRLEGVPGRTGVRLRELFVGGGQIVLDLRQWRDNLAAPVGEAPVAPLHLFALDALTGRATALGRFRTPGVHTLPVPETFRRRPFYLCLLVDEAARHPDAPQPLAVASVTVEETADPGRVQPMPSPLVGIVFPKTPSAAATGALGDSLPYVSGEIWLSLDIGDAYGTLWTPITLITPDQDR